MRRPKFTPRRKLPLPVDDHHLIHPSLDRPPLTTPNGIRIQSAVLPQYTFRTHRQTDRWDRRQTCTKSAYAHARLTESDALTTVLMISYHIKYVHILQSLPVCYRLSYTRPLLHEQDAQYSSVRLQHTRTCTYVLSHDLATQLLIASLPVRYTVTVMHATLSLMTDGILQRCTTVPVRKRSNCQLTDAIVIQRFAAVESKPHTYQLTTDSHVDILLRVLECLEFVPTKRKFIFAVFA